MNSCALRQPKGYYVVGVGGMQALCRRDGTEVWRFDPAAVLEAEVILTAYEDHSVLLMSEDEGSVVSRLSNLKLVRVPLRVVRKWSVVAGVRRFS